MTHLEILVEALGKMGVSKPTIQRIDSMTRKDGHWGDTRETAGKWIESEVPLPGKLLAYVDGSVYFEFDAEGNYKDVGFDDPDY